MTPRRPFSTTASRSAGAILDLLMPLAACVQTPPAATSPSVAAESDASVEPVSGISKDALIAIMGIPDGGTELLIGVYYVNAKIDRAQLAAAPPRICKSRGKTLRSAEDQPLVHPDSLPPGTRQMIVRCR